MSAQAAAARRAVLLEPWWRRLTEISVLVACTAALWAVGPYLRADERGVFVRLLGAFGAFAAACWGAARTLDGRRVLQRCSDPDTLPILLTLLLTRSHRLTPQTSYCLRNTVLRMAPQVDANGLIRREGVTVARLLAAPALFEDTELTVALLDLAARCRLEVVGGAATWLAVHADPDAVAPEVRRAAEAARRTLEAPLHAEPDGVAQPRGAVHVGTAEHQTARRLVAQLSDWRGARRRLAADRLVRLGPVAVEALLGSRVRSVLAVEVLVQIADPRGVGLLVEALHAPTRATRQAARMALLHALPRMRAEDAGLLTPAQYATLRNVLYGRDVPLIHAVLKAYEQIGQPEELRRVSALEAGALAARRDYHLRKEAQACAECLRSRLQQEAASQTLLRPVTGDGATADRLVRPAGQGTSDEEHLVRPSQES